MKHFAKKQFLFFLITPFFSFKALSAIPYEKCHALNKSQTQRVVDHFNNTYDIKTEADFCYECHKHANEFFDDIEDTHKEIDNPSIPEECFFASFLRGFYIKPETKYRSFRDAGGYFHCKEQYATNYNLKHGMSLKGDDKPYTTKPICFSREYSKMIATVVNQMADCFGFDNAQKKDMFNLFHHEGSFILNNSSNEKARCFGQVTKTNMQETHRRIDLSNKTKDSKGEGPPRIYQEVSERCPFSKKTHSKVQKNWKKLTPSTTCEVTHDPYKCAFYSMFALKIGYKTMDDFLKKDYNPELSESVKSNLPGNLKKLLPVRINEILLFKGKITKNNGKTVEGQWLFKDLKKAIKFTQDRQSIAELNMYKLPVIENEGSLKRMLSLWSYNGGVSGIKTSFLGFVEDLKEDLVDSKCTDSSCKWSKHRQDLLNKTSVNLKDFKENFEKHLRKHNGSQPADFVKKIISDATALKSSKERSKHLNLFMKRSHCFLTQGKKCVARKAKKIPPKNQDQAKKFIKRFEEKCLHLLDTDFPSDL